MPNIPSDPNSQAAAGYIELCRRRPQTLTLTLTLTLSRVSQKETTKLSGELKSSEEALQICEQGVVALSSGLAEAEAQVASLELCGSRNKWENRYYQCIWPLEKGSIDYWDRPDGKVRAGAGAYTLRCWQLTGAGSTYHTIPKGCCRLLSWVYCRLSAPMVLSRDRASSLSISLKVASPSYIFCQAAHTHNSFFLEQFLPNLPRLHS